MRKTFITTADTKLAYLDKNEDKEHVIFFIHGNSISSSSWASQFNSELLKNYRLITIDLPAHGDSAVATDSASGYSIPGLGATLATTIKTLAGIRPYIIAGISLGTNIIAEPLAFGLQPQGLVLAGSCLVGGKYTLNSFAYPETHIHVVFTEEAPDGSFGKTAEYVVSLRKTYKGGSGI